MKRVGNLYNKMLTRETMEEAYRGVMRDKKGKQDPTSLAFMMKNNKEYYIADAADILARRAFKPRKPREAYRYDAGSGKLRHIQAPILYPDQLVHWALITVTRDIFMKGMDHWCCASVKDRGILYAKNFISKTLSDTPGVNIQRKYKYCLKMDIRKFFENINREELMKKLERKIKDKEILDMFRKIIYSVPGTGLPLGYYTSQWLANFFLQDYDHNLRENLMPKYDVSIYVRYMDDMVILGSNKRKLQYLMKEINEYLNTLGLELKNTSCIFEIAERPIDFIGFRFSYNKTVLRKGILHRTKDANDRLYDGKMTLTNLRSMCAYNGWLTHSDSKEFQKEHLQGTRSLEIEKLRILSAKQQISIDNSPEHKQLLKVVYDIDRLRETSENNDGRVLIRYYKNSDEVRVVARTHYKFPDEAEYQAKQKALLEKPKKKKKRSRRKSYYPSADIYFSDKDKHSVVRDYNHEINMGNALNSISKV